ncbi:MAG: type II secretion system protein [Clostridiales bacterium]|nr:type II secretion system protein [Clostridiales bacterium]
MKTHACLKSNRHGFTMLELVAVLAVLTILLGIALPSLAAYVKNGREHERQSHEELVEKAIRQYYAFEGHYPDLDPDSPDPENGELSPEKAEKLKELLRSVTAVRINTDKYIFYYFENTGQCTLEIK